MGSVLPDGARTPIGKFLGGVDGRDIDLGLSVAYTLILRSV